MVDSPVPLLVYDNGENLMMEQIKEPEDWKLMGKKSVVKFVKRHLCQGINAVNRNII